MSSRVLTPRELSSMAIDTYHGHYISLYQRYQELLSERDLLLQQNNRKRKTNRARTSRLSEGGRLRHMHQEPEVAYVISEWWRRANDGRNKLPTASEIISAITDWRAVTEPELLSPHDRERRRLKSATIKKWRSSFTKAWAEEQENFDRFSEFARFFHRPDSRPRPI